MPKSISVIPKAPVIRILLKAGAKRVSSKAADEFVTLLTSTAERVASDAAKIARHSGRRTVQEGDIIIAGK